MQKEHCCICNKEIHGYGNSPYPVNMELNAKCCDTCAATVVIPARLELIERSKRKHGKK